MPNMDWDAFQDAHYRPHLIVTTLELGPDPASDKTIAALFERIATTLECWVIIRSGRTEPISTLHLKSTRMPNGSRACCWQKQP